MTRGRKKKFKLHFNIKFQSVKSVLAILFLLLSGLILVSFFAQSYPLNAKIQSIVRSLFGLPSLLLPFVLFLMGLLLISSIKSRLKEPRIVIGLGLLFVVSTAIFQIFHLENNANIRSGGGLVGYKIAQTMVQTISIYGAILVLMAAVLVSLILIFDVSLEQMFSFLGKFNIFSKLRNLNLPIGTKKEQKDANITISSGSGTFSQNDESDATGSAAAAPSFEIVPSMSEPQSGKELEALGVISPAKHDSLISIAQGGLPYADKVWETPPMELLADAASTPPDRADINEKAKIIKETLKSFGINVEVADIQSGPAVTQYALEAETGTKISKIASYQYDLAMALSSPTGSVRIEAPIPGKALIGIEVPNNVRVIVNIKSLLVSEPMKALKSKLGIVLGKDVGGLTRVADIGKMPHLLVAGTTGSGKSVFLHSLIFSILYRASPQECKFILMDPKRTELVHYNDIPHLLCPVVTDVDKAASAFKWAVSEMERRYKLFESAKARNIESYNEKSGFQALPYVIIVVDELAEIMVVDPAAVEKSIIRIAQLARATGIHLVLAVQRPSTNIITGLIKANIPARIAFNVASQIDSRVIIDQPGAEKLLGKGDMLFVPPDMPKPIRLQGAFVTDKEIVSLVNYLKDQGVKPDYRAEIFDMVDRVGKSVSMGGGGVDDLFDEASEIVIASGKASASLLQRRLSIGYARAARIIDELEQKGLIGPASGSKPRGIIMRGDYDISDTDIPVDPNP